MFIPLLCRDLGGNPLVCDCHMSWIFQLPTTVTLRNAVCMDPPSLQNMGLITETVSMRINETCPGEYKYSYVRTCHTN